MHEIQNNAVEPNIVEKKKKEFSFGILLGLVFLLPIFFAPSESFSFLFSKNLLIYFAVILMSILWIVGRLKDGKFPITKNGILLTGASIPVIYLISSLISGSPMTSLIGQGFETGTALSIIALFLLMFLTTSVVKNKERIYYIFFTLFLSFLFISIIQLLRLFVGPEFLSFGVMTTVTSNLIGKWNELSIFYGLTAILSLIMIEFINYSKTVKILSYVTLLISLFFIALVNLSSVWIILGIFSFILVSFVISSNKFNKKHLSENRPLRKFPAISFVTVLLSLIFVVGSGSVGSAISSFYQISETEVRPSFQGTMDIAKGTLKSKESLLGAGPNKFSKQWAIYKPEGVNETNFWNTDFNVGASFLITSLVTVGLIGFILWIIFLGLLFFKAIKVAFVSIDDKSNDYLLPISLISALYLWIFSIIYVPTNVIMALTFIFTGVMISLLAQNNLIEIKTISFAENQKVDFVLVLVLIFLVLMSVIGGYVISQKFVASVYSQKSLTFINGKNPNLNEAEKNIIKAINLSENDSYYRFLSEINLVKLQGLLSQKDLSKEELQKQFQALLSNAIQNAKKATEIDKTNYQNWLSLGRVYESVILFGIPGAYEQATDAYIKAVNLNPKNPALMLTLGALSFNNKSYENAVAALERAVILKPTYSDAKYFLSLSYYALGKNEQAIAQMEDVVLLNPENKEVKNVLQNMKKGVKAFSEESPVSETEEKATKTKSVTED